MAASKRATGSGSAKATIDHDEIRQWVESHDGHPAMVKRTARGGRGGILRIDFPGFSGERSLEEVSWDDFFDKFEESQLAFLYQEQTASGRPSRFNKLVARDSVEVSSPDRRASKRATRASGKKAAGRSPAGVVRAKKRSSARTNSSAATRRRAKSSTKKARGGTTTGARTATQASRSARSRTSKAKSRPAKGRRSGLQL
ncbi:MAG TPA: hypothetical protein VGL19_04345 [Polyangiaceae bacterium]